ncbi:hypothetical protein BGW39_007390 [Mortierella sp. 14UC]|nr:hypothetical protein BGW39_007390 [Mortierella sp. 14UC]
MVLLRSSLCKISTAAFHSSRQTQAASLVIPETLLALKTLHGEPFFVPAFMFSYTAAYLTFGSHLFSNAVNSSWAVMHNQISGRLVQELLDKELIVKDPQDKSFQLVNHVFRNLLEGAVANNGQLLKPFLKDAITADAANSSFGNPSENGSGINTGSKDSGFGKRPFMVYVSKDNGQLAFADGFRNIVIEQDLIRMIGYDEDLVAAMLAHELAHAMQDHVQEKISLKTVFA